MSPFALYLQKLRLNTGLRQRELAELAGCHQGHISALELGSKGPTPDLADRLVKTLELSPEEESELRKAMAASQRKLYIDADASEDIYLLLNELRNVLPELSNTKARVLRDFLKLPDAHDIDSASARGIRARRKARAEM